MYCIKFIITPTAVMTFRILPGSILNIATYPFVPPTTLSGFLRRLIMLSAGLELPETNINKDNPPFYALPRHIVSLGAYPVQKVFSGVHRTYRKGMRDFNHDFFSRLYIEKDKANFQLHTWEYLIAEELVGYVVSESLSDLEHFQKLKDYGCKIGKEGFAIVKQVSAAIELQRETIEGIPATIVPTEDLLQSNTFAGGCDIYNLYRYNWSIDPESEGFIDRESTPIEGFIPFVAAYFSSPTTFLLTLDYYTNGEIYIPVSLVNLLKGETDVRV